MPLFIIILVPLAVIVMIGAFVANAIALKRDLDRRFEDFRDRLETQANSTLDTLLKAESCNDNSPNA
jgi:hypothetical protein